MKLKTLAATAAAVALVAVTAAPAPASAGGPPSDCKAHLDTVFGGICIPTP